MIANVPFYVSLPLFNASTVSIVDPSLWILALARLAVTFALLTGGGDGHAVKSTAKMAASNTTITPWNNLISASPNTVRENVRLP